LENGIQVKGGRDGPGFHRGDVKAGMTKIGVERSSRQIQNPVVIGKYSELCELWAAVVNISSQETQKNQINKHEVRRATTYGIKDV
jgi:hypothetical protein